MIKQYEKTPLEEWIEKLFIAHGICSPSDLSISNISKSFNINVYYIPKAPDQAIWDEEQTVIFLNSDRSEKEMREIFFHELAHPLLHYGDQTDTTTDFRSLQERQAHLFQQYAAMPIHMIMQYKDTPMTSLIPIIAEDFSLSLEFVQHRINQIRRRIYQTHIDQEIQTSKKTPAREWSTETQKILDKLHRQINSKIQLSS